jgi:TatA/E family protein of Tat protein translocase
VFAFILEGLGSTELIFILVVALIFFGPRKLPQLAKSMGKGLAEFRKASDDFKRTWEREVALETAKVEDSSLLESERAAYEHPYSITTPVVEQPDAELVVARENAVETTAADSTAIPVDSTQTDAVPVEVVPADSPQIRKQDWL